MTTVQFPDVMYDIRYWLRNDPTFGPLVSKRVFWRLPDVPQTPMVLIREMPSGPELDAEVPLESVQIMVEIWGMQNSDYTALRQVDLALRHICWKQSFASVILNPSGQSRMVWVRYLTGYDSPDPDTGWPRRIAHLDLGILPTGPTTF